MKKLCNTLYILTENSYLHCENGTICVKIGGTEKTRIPAHTVDSIICLCNTTVSSPFIGFCGEQGISLSFHSDHGRFYGRITGPVSGNVLLRTKQYQWIGSPESAEIVRNILSGKLLNSRNLLLKSARNTTEDKADILRNAAQMLSEQQTALETADSIDRMLVDPAQFAQIKAELSKIIDSQTDSIRFYRLGSKWETKIETMGLEKGIRQDEPLLL
ncbi:MAG: CRISPR-associated endonuclease Cas1 [Oscillospiraceae bacterium]|nr:CRISPR-associated endonuclease Cas1 [Oscillospiraceae bacterium]